MTVRVSLLASAITAMIREDPTLFVAQASRRYLPSHVRDALGRLAEHTPSSAVRHALALVSDRPDLSSEATHSTSGSRSRARRLWDLGDVPGALATLDPHDSLARRLAEEWQLLRAPRLHLPGGAPSSPGHVPLSRPPAVNSAGIDVLHFLNNSAPYTQSGYTVRTARLLETQAAMGLTVAAATRIGYPVITGSWRVPDSSVVGGIEYHRLLPTSLERMPVDRLAQQAVMLEGFGAATLPGGAAYHHRLPQRRRRRSSRSLARYPLGVRDAWTVGKVVGGAARSGATGRRRPFAAVSCVARS